jgi:hypothetical protein
MILESLHQNDELESCEPLCDRPSLRTWARETVAAYRTDQKLTEATVRQGKGMWWLPSWYRKWLDAPVIAPAPGEIQRKLYGL